MQFVIAKERQEAERKTIEAHLATQAEEVAGKNDDEFLAALDKIWQAHKVAMQRPARPDHVPSAPNACRRG